MKTSLLALFVLLAVPFVGTAQVSVEVLLPPGQQQFLVGESLPVAVRIKNRSGQTLKMGTDPDWLTFSLESREGFIVIKKGEVPVKGEFNLKSSQVATTRRVDLAPYFALPRQGRYNVAATVRIQEWNAEVTSEAVSFDVISGVKLWSEVFGVTDSTAGTNSPPEVRKFTLEQANYLRSQPRLYMRLTDAQGDKVIKVTAIGPMVSFGTPEAELDKVSAMHVLYQNGARSFGYNVFSADGELVIRQSYDYSDTRPRLATDQKGNIGVVGGFRRRSGSDLPVETDTAIEVTPPKAVALP